MRGADYAKYCHETYDLSNPAHLVLTSIVTKGELLALAEKRNWGSKKREIYDQKLNEFPSIDISSDQVVTAYARIKAKGSVVSEPAAIYGDAARFQIGYAEDFDAKFALDTTRFWNFLETTQKEELAKLKRCEESRPKHQHQHQHPHPRPRPQENPRRRDVPTTPPTTPPEIF